MLIEGLLALVIFSVALIGLLMLMSVATLETGNARYRSEASFLASDLIARLWSGDRSAKALQTRFADSDGDEYQSWLQRVQTTLPGSDKAGNVPAIEIDDDRHVTITLGWQAPGDAAAHRLMVTTQVTD